MHLKQILKVKKCVYSYADNYVACSRTQIYVLSFMYELQTVSVKNRGKYTCTLYMVIQIKTRAIRYDEFFPSLVLNNLIIWGSVRKNLLIEYKKTLNKAQDYHKYFHRRKNLRYLRILRIFMSIQNQKCELGVKAQKLSLGVFRHLKKN